MERYKIRSGIESTNAELKSRHGARSMRVRGKARVEMSMQMKATALNVKRATFWHAAQGPPSLDERMNSEKFASLREFTESPAEDRPPLAPRVCQEPPSLEEVAGIRWLTRLTRCLLEPFRVGLASPVRRMSVAGAVFG